MATIEEILEKNVANNSLGPNILYKELITPAVMNFIIYANRQFTLSDNTIGLNKLVRHLKLIIGGGAAFDYYVKHTAKTGVLNTHDFDMRLFLDIPPSKSPLFTSDQKMVENWMLGISKELGGLFAEYLNKYVDDSNIENILNSKNIYISKFTPVERGFLTTVEYKLEYMGQDYLDSMVDIVPHIPSKAIHYGPLELDKSKNFSNYNKKDFSGVTSRNGFFQSSIVYTKNEYGIYYASLGFLIWDTVRMLNYIIDAKYGGTNRPNVDPTVKFERYLEKYKVLLSSLSRPELYLNCNAFSKFIGKCNKLKQVCLVDDTKITSKSDLVYKGIEKGVFPNETYWYREMLKMDFSSLCNTVLQ
jgi:hypothetical protein